MRIFDDCEVLRDIAIVELPGRGRYWRRELAMSFITVDKPA